MKNLKLFLIFLLGISGCNADPDKIRNNIDYLYKNFNNEYNSYICIRINLEKYKCIVSSNMDRKILLCDNKKCIPYECNDDTQCFKFEKETIDVK